MNIDTSGEFPAKQLVVACRRTGTIIVVALSEGRRPTGGRALVFHPAGVTVWHDTPVGTRGHRTFIAEWTKSAGGEHVSFTAKGAILDRPAEVGDTSRPDQLVPLTITVDLRPLSMRVGVDDPATPAAGTAFTAQSFRVRGSLATASIAVDIEGDAWVTAGAVSLSGAPNARRIQALFQDGSAVLATTVQDADPVARAAVYVKNAAVYRMPVTTLAVEGHDRRQPSSAQIALGARHRVLVHGHTRSEDQHIAFVDPDGAGGWTRTAYTPSDFVCGGITGFGIVEQSTTVSSPAMVLPDERLPHTF